FSDPGPVFHTIVSIKNDGHYFCRAGGNRPDGLNEPVTIYRFLQTNKRVKDKPYSDTKWSYSYNQNQYNTSTFLLPDSILQIQKNVVQQSNNQLHSMEEWSKEVRGHHPDTRQNGDGKTHTAIHY
ncbi:hypothetical protein K9T71_01295, partial [Escherichia coli]|uniref:hypothetical protein n=1 Tax=Escherichia coli TaxID=562 RepID=UPI001FB1C300